jgi:hypothetical protein
VTRTRTAAWTWLLCGALVLAPPLQAGDDPRRAESRALAAEFQRALGAELASALARGGPVHAIAVCSEEAPAIADGLSRTATAQVRRTALAYRNQANAPDPEARRVLQAFEARLAAQRDAPEAERAPPEHFAVREDGGARYMRAILTQPMCLACHGEHLAPEVRAAVAEHYPDDRATGFAVGDLRGAFVIDWPATEDSP